ncbi:uncharacterized protein si:dkeyp-97a10.3 isoform X2 [Anguilla rostrata]|uniref:uncharacterized protein si:dkeyp-97a10.3 isoform X2 n=1 Tax=Anguilla rostrata TaxID=7938 RepID=UPI0030D560E0
MNLLPVVAVIVSAVLPPVVRSQDPVPIQFQPAPVLVASGVEAVMTVVTVSQVLSVTWMSPARETLGLWVPSGSVINPVAQYQGRLTISATQLRIAATQLRDTGNYTVTVDPMATTGLGPNTRSVQLRVFDAVVGVRLLVPTVAMEGGNVTLQCTWTQGTDTGVIWGKGGAALTPDSRVTISGGFLVINPARRGDAGQYSCTVSNLVSAQTATNSLTVYYGPDTPVLDRGLQADCVGGGQALVGQTVRLSCTSDSLPPALFSWQQNGVPVASGQPDSGVLSIQTFSTNQSGRYVCTARNAVTGGTSQQGTDVVIVTTCLSAGAVAGIVIGCILALILIIIAIFLLVRWRKVDRRLRQAAENPKPDGYPQRHDPPLQPALPHPRNGRPGDQRLHSLDTLHRGDYALPPDGYRGVDIRRHHHQGNGNVPQLDGQLNTGAFPPNGVANGGAFPPNGVAFWQNGWQNPNAFPQNGQQNPNVLIQTGQTHPSGLPPAVHVNLNTLPNAGQQPNTVHVNLNTYPNGGQQDPHSLQHNNDTQPHASQHNNRTPQHNNQDTDHTLQHSNHQNMDSMAQIVHSDRAPLVQTGVSHPTDRSRRASHNRASDRDDDALGHGDLVQTGYSHLVNPAPASRRNADTQTYQRDSNPRPGRDRDPAGTRGVSRDSRDPARSQMPWDRLRGTPAYPNDGFRGDSDTSTDEYQPRGRGKTDRSDPGRPPPDSAPNDRSRPPVETRTAERSPRSRAKTVTLKPDPSTPPPPYNQAGPHAPVLPQNQTARPTRFAPQGEDVQRTPIGQPLPAGHGQAATHNAPQQRPQTLQTPDVAARAGTWNLDPQTGPQRQGNQQQGAPLGPGAQAPPARQLAAPAQVLQAPPTAAPNSNSLTQSALQAHTAQTRNNPFRSRNQQTAAALRNPGGAAPPPAQPRPPNAGPAPPTAPQAAAVDRRPPTLPPVMPLSQFQALPKKHLPVPAARPQPVPVPAAAPHRHPAQPNRQRHPPNAPRHPAHGHPPNGHPAHGHPPNGHPPHGHPNAHRQAAGGRARR